MNRARLLRNAALALILAASTTPLYAQAQDSAAEIAADDESEATGEDIVVTGAFLDTGASSATKLNIDVKDVPLSVAAYSEEFLDAIQANSVSDLYRYMTGVQRSGRSGVDIVLRGFESSNNDRNAIMTDGLPGLSGRGSPPTIGTDHIELVKGPASILYGQVQPGGFVNVITKKPQATENVIAEMTLEKGIGKYDRAIGGLFAIDATGPLSESGSVSARAVFQVGYGEGFRKLTNEQPLFVAPSVSFDLGATRVTLLGEYQRTRSQFDSFLVAPGADIANIAPIDTIYQEPDDYELGEGYTGTVLVGQDLAPDVSLNGGFRYVWNNLYVQTFEPIAFRNLTTLQRRARRQDNLRTYAFGDVNLAAKFDVFGIRVNAVLGASMGRETADLERVQFFNAPATGPNSLDISVYNPQLGLARPIGTYPLFASLANLTHRLSSSVATGAYFSGLFEFSEQIKMMAGLRYSHEHLKVREVFVPNTPSSDVKVHSVLPMIGAIYQPVPQISLYASYSTSFAPVQPTAVDINGNYSFKPTEGKAVEVGAKTELLDGRVRFTFAYFDIRKINTTNRVLGAGGTIAEQVGGERSNGFELEGDLQITDQWQVVGGVTALDPRITKSNIPNQLGATLANATRFAAQAYSRYTFDRGPLANFGFGVGLSHSGERNGLLPTLTSTNTLKLPAYTLVDTSIFYRTAALEVTAKMSNLFDERYFESVGPSGEVQLLPGQPRLFRLTARMPF